MESYFRLEGRTDQDLPVVVFFQDESRLGQRGTLNGV